MVSLHSFPFLAAYAYLSRQRDGAAMYVNEAVGEVMAVVLSDAYVYPFGRRVRFAGRVVGTEFGMFADDARLARHVLVAFDLALSTRVTSLQENQESAQLRGAVVSNRPEMRRVS